MPVPDQNVAAVITVNDMYHELQGVRSDVQTLVGKFDDIPRQIAELQAASKLTEGLPADVADHEKRLRTIEPDVAELKTTVGALPRSAVSWTALSAVLGALLGALGVVAAFLAVIH